MIDTDKYEGHTLGPWEWDGLTLQTIEELDDGYIGVIDDQQSYHLGQRNHPDAQLIADAPLLLAEVKRLHQLIKDIGDSSKGNDEYIQARIKEELE